MVNEKIKNYISSRNIDVKDSKTNDTMNSYDEYNKIFSEYGIYKEAVSEDVCVANIHSSVMGGSESVYEEASSIFDDNKTNYEARDNDMLEYPSDELVVALRPSYLSEPVKLIKLSDNDYVINSNGRHRVNLLKINYISEVQNDIEGNKEEIDKKYTIPCDVEEIDKTKTFANFILKKIDKEKYSLSSEFDEKYKKTGNARIRVDGEDKIMDDASLISYLKEELSKNISAFPNIAMDGYDSLELKKFMEDNFSEISGYSDYLKLVENINKSKNESFER